MLCLHDYKDPFHIKPSNSTNPYFKNIDKWTFKI